MNENGSNGKPASAGAVPPAAAGGASVLVVDDEKLIRWSVSERLARQGYEVRTAESGEQALELICAARPDLMLLDVRLPGLDGVETLRRALQLHPHLATVMMSAHSTVDIAVEAMKDGALDFLVKPFPLAQLDAAVQRGLAAVSSRKALAAPHAIASDNPQQGGMIGASQPFLQLNELLARLAANPSATVLILGESGSGKEQVGRTIHFASARAARPFMQINCAALPEHLLESELFGHERGAFTDAHSQKRGLFESAEGGTVMLDEIGDLPPGGQAKLLRLLENKTFRRVGGAAEQAVDVRVIAATNADLAERVKEQRFRADLYFRLNVIRLQVPSLRERVSDIPLLAAHFLARFSEEMGRSRPASVSPRALELMQAYPWPGNVRELRNAMERALTFHPELKELRPEHLPPELLGSPGAPVPALTPPLPAAAAGVEPGDTLSDTEKKLIVAAMERAHGNQTQAAKALGVSRDTLRYRLRKYGLV